MRFIFPTLLLLASLGLFVLYTNPTYKKVNELRNTDAAYTSALSNSRKLISVRDTLAEKYNSLSLDDRDRLMKLMPDNVDNIRLILDIEKIARQYGMLPSGIKFDASKTEKQSGTTATQPKTPAEAREANLPYGTFDLEFTVSGSYAKFLSFLRDMEQSLRIVDLEAIAFSSSGGEQGQGNQSPLQSGSYRYTFKIKTYWLKN